MGIYANTIIAEQCKRMKIPIEDMINFILPNFILPAQESHINNLRNNLTRLDLRYTMLSPKQKQKNKSTNIQRIMPLIKNDGTLLIT